ncbi:MAG TPA: PQQ-binding-like beta-propeller repeat protein [Gaiellaceae bacterium]|jgi:outer membrane protein assembly factor BamB|nr:PQQ-binding-like beta-propeller repeat protein [Gaiellaceae bacterium]
MKKWLLGAGAVVLLVAAGLIAYALYRKHEGRDIRGSSVEFVTTQEDKSKPNLSTPWPMYRFDSSREGLAVGVPADIHPPLEAKWFFRGKSLIEFPPSVAYGNLYFANSLGSLYSVKITRVRAQWVYRTGRCTAATPAVADHLVYMTFLNKPPCNATRSGLDGELVALDADSGKVRWKVTMAPTESSPLVVGGLVYVGDWSGKVYALNAKSGRVVWTYQTGDKVKDGLAYAGGRVFFGSYDTHVYALSARTGKLIWKSGAQQRLGATGTFYSTPAVAYGRVYVGATDGKMYSFGATSGKLRWSHGTGSYVYASPAVWNRTVYAGSYDGTFYAFDAATGDVRWQFKTAGPISGSAVVINGVVYVSCFGGRTYGLDARTGKVLWLFKRGRYAGVVADTVRLYAVGYGRIFAFFPKGRR